jgi:hypothetical protein
MLNDVMVLVFKIESNRLAQTDTQELKEVLNKVP